MTRNATRVAVASCAMALFAIALGLWVWIFHFTPAARHARAVGHDPIVFVPLRAIQGKVDEGRGLSQVEMAALSTFSTNSSELIRIRALSSLGSVTGERNVTMASRIAREGLRDPSPNVRRTALIALHRLRSRDIDVIAKGALSDSDARVRETAKRILGTPVSQ